MAHHMDGPRPIVSGQGYLSPGQGPKRRAMELALRLRTIVEAKARLDAEVAGIVRECRALIVLKEEDTGEYALNDVDARSLAAMIGDSPPVRG